MLSFKIHPQLLKDCFHLGQLNGQELLLLNNSLIPWFIILPITQETELYKLEISERQKLDKNIHLLSEFISNHYNPDKLNVASIGNMVPQMHMHVIGRFESDPYWPGVVWGRDESRCSSNGEILELVKTLQLSMPKQIFVVNSFQ